MKVGYRNTRWLLLGIYTGFTLVMFITAVFSEVLIKSYSLLLEYLKWLGVLYLLYLAWTVAKSGPVVAGAADSPDAAGERSAFWKGFLLQLVNVKIIIYGITAFSVFVYPHFDNIATTIAFALFLSLVGSLSTWVWALAGQKLTVFLNRYAILVNRAMALLLIYCAVSLFF